MLVIAVNILFFWDTLINILLSKPQMQWKSSYLTGFHHFYQKPHTRDNVFSINILLQRSNNSQCSYRRFVFEMLFILNNIIDLYVIISNR